ncbi:MAG: DUF3347 domain-containing protein [Myxococcales bacterium]|nr:DUF3347 domain-containing protein [Myxococcales bacterium]MCB9566819.1 DUF3347 domain-containing protein [Myxococcales bacterium]MCB9704553.1 DUF3347 domain-containing protein [Myxococcales bacterium]
MVRRALALSLVSALVLGFGACGAKGEGSGGEAAASAGEGGAKAAAPAGASAFLTPYITIQETLADDSVDHLAELGAQVVGGAEALQDKPGVGDLLAGAGRIAAQDIETARVAFEKMSMGVIAYLKATPADRDGYEVVHCPMAFNNKGAYWVQKIGEITNPYHGKMMLRCGDKVEWEKAPG